MKGDGLLGLAIIVCTIWCLCSKGGSKRGSKRVVFHGHGDTRRRAWNHEKRHRRVLRGLKIAVDRIRVWEEHGGWAGETTINKSAANMRRWNALTPAEQAAVYMAGAMGREQNYGCEDDLAEVDARTSRRTAARIARTHLR